ncbi:aminotransferase class I/II-fold pyridoxal phosphate-dependent enzyme [Aerococcus sp.]|uniref:aminotransferase class I/II-fold pyridoxal phosphate-dependent enzyme n=1 Tax=Aerococcus sp. TaxID=1872398 RepID=UPI0025BA56E6|nr:aminotransferase class I/II-fold pyridoxal phosphate-dependent enzyme [Aerococcus sp.]MBR2130649.1 aminotransferase class I/II-fold pyridoxal phosphate-dependent enzyme [Aerococcus sp.]
MVDFQPSNIFQSLPSQYFSSLTAAISDLKSRYDDVIDLAVGTPDLPAPQALKEVLRSAIDNPKYDRYGPYRGEDLLKQAVAKFYHHQFGVDIDPETEVALFHGSKEAIMKVSQVLVNKGDGILLPNPTYPDYLSAIGLTQADTIFMDLLAENNYLVDFDQVAQGDRDRAKVMYLNYPNNPTGALATPGFFEDTVAVAKDNKIFVVHDFAYAPYVFDQAPPLSYLETPGAKAVGLELFSLSKFYNIPGWRVGFAVGNPQVVGYLNSLQDHTTVGMYGAIQEAVAALLADEDQDFTSKMKATYQARRDAVIREFDQAGIQVTPSKGTIYQWMQTPKGVDAETFARAIAEDVHVGVAPGNGFGTAGQGYIRIGLIADTVILQEAASRIARVYKQFNN